MSSGVLLTDLSKTFDCPVHDLLIAKSNACGFDLKLLHLINNYLTCGYQRVRIGCKYSSWGAPQGPILGPIPFHIYISDLFFFTDMSEIASYAEDVPSYTARKKSLRKTLRFYLNGWVIMHLSQKSNLT